MTKFPWQRPLPTAKRRASAFAAESGSNYALALDHWRALADAGDAEACAIVGDRYERGLGVVQSFVDAVAWFRRAADAGWTPAIAKLGEIYLVGRTAPRTVSASGDRARSPGGAFDQLTNAALPIAQDFAEAARWNLAAAQADDVGAMLRWAYQCASGKGTALNYVEAEKWFAAAAARNDPAGQFGLGMLFAGGYGRPQDVGEAAFWFQKASQQGHANAKLCLAVLLANAGADGDLAREATDLVAEAAEAGLVEAMYHLGRSRLLGYGCTIDLSDAEHWLRRAAINGHVRSMTVLGDHLQARAFPDHASAAAFYREAGDLGDGLGQYRLAELYANGQGVPKDGAVAATWFKKAAEHGIGAAYERLGSLYADGAGVPLDFSLAAEWFTKAAQAGEVRASYKIGLLHHRGLGVTPAPDVALSYFQRAADEGDGQACLQLGVMYAEGELGAPDFDQAAVWYRRAADRGVREGLWNLAFLMIRELADVGNVEEGMSILSKSAEDGDPTAAFALYNLFASGRYLPGDALKADHWLKVATLNGSEPAALEVIRRLEAGESSPLEITQASVFLKRASDAGSSAAQSVLGRLLYQGALLQKDLGAALTLLNRAATAGDVFAQAWLGDVLSKGDGVLLDQGAARSWYQKAAIGGHLGALMALTGLVVNPDAPDGGEGPRLVFALWSKRASSEDALAARMVGDYLMRGVGCDLDVMAGANWLRTASVLGNPAAASILAARLLQNQAPALSQQEPYDLMQRAAKLGDKDAAYNLGVCFRRGLGVPQNLTIAKSLYTLAAQDRHTSAQLALADLILQLNEGEGAIDEARGLYLAAAEGGRSEGYIGLGQMYETGLGGAVDLQKAQRTYLAAAKAGNDAGRVAADRCARLIAEAKSATLAANEAKPTVRV